MSMELSPKQKLEKQDAFMDTDCFSLLPYQTSEIDPFRQLSWKLTTTKNKSCREILV